MTACLGIPNTTHWADARSIERISCSEITSGAGENSGDDRRKHATGTYVSASTAKNSDSARRIKMLEQRISTQDREIDRLWLAADHADSTCCPSFQAKDLSTPPVGSL